MELIEDGWLLWVTRVYFYSLSFLRRNIRDVYKRQQRGRLGGILLDRAGPAAVSGFGANEPFGHGNIARRAAVGRLNRRVGPQFLCKAGLSRE